MIVGRTAELETIDAFLASTGGVLLLEGEAGPHEHADGTSPQVDAPEAPRMQAHRHDDGTVESHPIIEPATTPASDEAEAPEEHHDHQP